MQAPRRLRLSTKPVPVKGGQRESPRLSFERRQHRSDFPRKLLDRQKNRPSLENLDIVESHQKRKAESVVQFVLAAGGREVFVLGDGPCITDAIVERNAVAQCAVGSLFGSDGALDPEFALWRRDNICVLRARERPYARSPLNIFARIADCQ
jgi:hypothetical protein